MLKHHRSIEEPGVRDDGTPVVWFRITDELVDDPCEWCGGESVPNICSGDGRYHHHGRVHTAEGNGPTPLCKMCAELDADAWNAKRGGEPPWWERR